MAATAGATEREEAKAQLKAQIEGSAVVILVLSADLVAQIEDGPPSLLVEGAGGSAGVGAAQYADSHARPGSSP